MNDNIYEGKTYQDHELKQLIEDFEKYFKENTDIPPVFKAKVDSNPYGEGEERELWFGVYYGDRGYLSSAFQNQSNIGGVDYVWYGRWTDGEYKGSITIIKLPKSQFQKPEVYKVGDWIQVMESVRDARGGSLELAEKLVGKIYQVSEVYDEMRGIYYLIREKESSENWYIPLPHYAVKKVPPPEEKVTITLTNEEYQQVQEILKRGKES